MAVAAPKFAYTFTFHIWQDNDGKREKKKKGNNNKIQLFESVPLNLRAIEYQYDFTMIRIVVCRVFLETCAIANINITSKRNTEDDYSLVYSFFRLIMLNVFAVFLHETIEYPSPTNTHRHTNSHNDSNRNHRWMHEMRCCAPSPTISFTRTMLYCAYSSVL